MASFWWNQCTPSPGFPDLVCGAELVGTEGIIDCRTYAQLRIARATLRSSEAAALRSTSKQTGEWELVYDQTQAPDARDRTFADQAREFVASILEQRPPEITGYDGRATVEIIEAAYRSADTATSVRLR